jgi:hypothetical protein
MRPSKSFFQQATASLLMYALAGALLSGPVHAQSTVSAQIANFPLGANIQVLLKTNKKVRGTRGADSATGFTLLDSKAPLQSAALRCRDWTWGSSAMPAAAPKP